MPWADLHGALQQLRAVCLRNDVPGILGLLQRLVPEAYFGSGIKDHLTAEAAVQSNAEAL